MVSIVIADDHQIVRQGTRKLLEEEPDFRVIGEAKDGIETLDLVENLKPDVLVVDFKMPGLSGAEVTHQVGRRSPGTQVVVLSMYSNETYVLEALRAGGAKGYVLKEATSDELVTAVRRVATGWSYLSSTLSNREIEVYKQKTKIETVDSYDNLTVREKQVLGLVTQGYTNAEIAERLVISQRTAEVHRARMMRKLNLRRQVELIRYALRRGLLTEESQSVDSA